MISVLPILGKHSFTTQVKRLILGRSKHTFSFQKAEDLSLGMDSDTFNG